MPYRQAVLRGDPGFLSSAFRTVSGAVTGGVRSLVTGGNPIIGAVQGGIAGARGPTPVAPVFSVSPGGTVPRVLTPGTSMVTAGGGMVGMSPLGTIGATAGRGMHPNRSSYYTRGGRVEKGTRLVRNRHPNWGNGRALKRALRRAHGFQHLARAVMSFTLTGKKHGAGHFKATRKGR
jgi:hypothetical protein